MEATRTTQNHRQSVRIEGYDYSRAGAYFVTICTRHREVVFGGIVNGAMILNEFGSVVSYCWRDLPRRFQTIGIDAFVIMPNHVHGIIMLTADSDPKVTRRPSVGAGFVTTSPRHAARPTGPVAIHHGAISRPAPTEGVASETIVSVGAGLATTTVRGAARPYVPSASHRGVVPRPAPTSAAAGPVSLPDIIRVFKSLSARRINGMRHTRGLPLWQRGYYEHVIRTEDELGRAQTYITDNPSLWSLDSDNPDGLAKNHDHYEHHPPRG